MLLFVYGTMRQAERNWNRLWECNAVRLGDGVEFLTEDRFDLYLADHNKAPIALRNPDGYPLAGELYAIPHEKVLHEIDPAEGHPDTYRREPVVLQRFKADDLTVYMYVFVKEITRHDQRVLMNYGVLRYSSNS